MTTVYDLISILRGTNKSIDFTEVNTNLSKAKSEFSAIEDTIFKNVGEIVNGIVSLTKTDSEKRVVSKITEQVSDVKLVNEVSSSASSDLSSITGSSVSGGFLHQAITTGNPKGISSTLEQISGKDTPQSVLKSISVLPNIVTQAITKVPYDELLKSNSKIQKLLDDVIQANSKFYINDIAEKQSKYFETKVNSLVDRTIEKQDLIESYKLVSQDNYDKAFGYVEKYINKSDNYQYEIENLSQNQWSTSTKETYDKINSAQEEFNKIKIDISEYVDQTEPQWKVLGTNSRPVKAIGKPYSQDGIMTGRSTYGNIWSFEKISSNEELESLFRNTTRNTGEEIVGAIIHWSATFINQNIDARWIHDLHIAKGYDGCGYHIVINRDGSLQRGRPLGLKGAHDINHNKNFLGFCFVGGINQSSRTAKKPYWRYASVDSLTAAQFNAYDNLMKIFYQVYPYAQVAGHYMTSSEGKVDPGFDVVEYSRIKFGVNNIIDENDQKWKQKNAITLDTIRNIQ